MSLPPLGDSPFNYDDYTASRFHHYWLKIESVLRYRLGRRLKGIKPAQAFEVFGCLPPLAEDHFHSHHWDLGCWPSTRRKVRKILQSHMTLVEERASVDDNCVFYVLRNEKEPSP